jgi:membrane-bound ClpP family serine protease
MFSNKTSPANHKLIETIGWIGVVLGLGAYTLVVFGIVPANNHWYLGLNIIGSVLLVYETVNKKDYQAMTVHAVVGLFALINMIRLFI